MGAMSRRKGKRGELEVVAIAKAIGFARAERTAPMQAGHGSSEHGDVGGIRPLYIEVKCHARVPVNRYAREVLDGPERPGMVRVLAWRDNRTEWRATVPLDDLLKLVAMAYPPTPAPRVDEMGAP